MNLTIPFDGEGDVTSSTDTVRHAMGIQKFLKTLDFRALALMMHFLFLKRVMAQKAQHTAHSTQHTCRSQH